MRTKSPDGLLLSGQKLGGGRGWRLMPPWPYLALGLLVFLAVVPGTLAQTTGSATLRGTVKDPNGAVVPKANVTLISEATKDQRKTLTTNEGFYTFASVDPGTYTLRVEAPNFATYEQTGIVLSPSDTRGADVTLKIGAASETVTVTAAAEQIQTETGAKENTITAKQIDNLSIISRSSLELLRILPGVVAPEQIELESISFGGGANRNTGYNVNGLRGENNTVTVDGSKMMDIGSNNGTIITANPDMVQEVKVQASNYAAEHGTSGVNIAAVTKAGSSSFHGEVYDYIRNWRFNANDRSNNYANVNNRERLPSNYNYPGGNIGGPVLIPGTGFNKNRDKLFFFFGFEYYYQRVDEGTALSVVPTLKQRRGDFSEFLNLPASILNQGGPLLDEKGNKIGDKGQFLIPGGFPGAGSPAPNNNLAPYIDPIGRALINSYPLPNYSNPSNRFNYAYSTLRPIDRNQAVARFDYNISDKTKLYVRLAREHEDQGFPRGLWWNSSDYELPGKLTGSNLGRSAVVNVTSLINPTMTNEVLFSGSKLKLDNNYRDPQKVTLQGLGIPQFGFFKNSNPYAAIGVIDAWGGGIGGNLFNAYGFPLFAYNDTFSITDNLTKVVNSHALKFGAFIEQANKKQNFNQDVDIELAQWGQPNGTGNNYGDLLVGRPIEVSMGTDVPTGNFRYYNYELYAQDSWKVRPNFTLEYGVRVAYLPNNFERNGAAVLFDPTHYDPKQGIFINNDKTRPNGILWAKRGEIPKGIVRNPPPQWMPRLNFAWDVNGKGNLVIRGGAGLFYNRVQGNYQYYSLQQMPNSYRATAGHWAQDGGITFGNLKNVDPFSSIANVDVTSANPDSIFIPRIANMSFSVATRLPFQQVLEVSYVGTQARHLPQNRNINVVPVGALLKGTVGNANLSDPIQRAALDTSAIKLFKPFQVYNNVTFKEYAATSSYHSLQATLSRQVGKNLQYFATYTFSKALGTTSVDENGTVVDPVDARHRSYGVLPYDRTHVFNLSYNYNLPDLAQGMLDNPVMRGVLNGWQMSGITTFQAGTPIRLRFTGDISGTGQALAFFGTDAFNTSTTTNVGAISPIYLKDPRVSQGKGVGDRILDISAIGIPTFGNTGPNQPPFYIRTPSRSNFDVSFFKNFKLTESKKLQFRTGFFNIFNQAYPTRIDTNNPNASDIYLTLNTTCNKHVTGDIPNGAGGTKTGFCDPTGGFSFTDETKQKFGQIQTKRGRRVVEFALKFYF